MGGTEKGFIRVVAPKRPCRMQSDDSSCRPAGVDVWGVEQGARPKVKNTATVESSALVRWPRTLYIMSREAIAEHTPLGVTTTTTTARQATAFEEISQ